MMEHAVEKVFGVLEKYWSACYEEGFFDSPELYPKGKIADYEQMISETY